MPNNFKKMSKVQFTYEMRDQLGDLSDQLNKIGSNCKWYEELKPIAQPIIDSQFSFNNIIPDDVEENEYNKAIKDLSKLKDLFSAKNFRKMLDNKAFSEHYIIDVDKFLKDLAFFSDLYDMGINVEALRKLYNSSPEKQAADEEKIISTEEKIININTKEKVININDPVENNEQSIKRQKMQQTSDTFASFKHLLDKKHRIPFIGGGTSDELQKVKDAIARYNRFLNKNNDDIEFIGVSETELLKNIKTAGEEYIEKKKENRWKDTSREDWTPNTRMGTDRYNGVKGVIGEAARRIKEIDDDIAQSMIDAQKRDKENQKIKEKKKETRQLNGTVEDMIDDIIYEGNLNRLSEDKLKERFVKLIAYEKIAAKYGMESIVNDHLNEYKQICDGLLADNNFSEFFTKWKTQIANSSKFFADNRSANEECEKYQLLKQQTKQFHEMFGEGSVGARLADIRFDVLSDESNYKDELLKDIIAAEIISSDNSFSAPLDEQEFNRVRAGINEQAFENAISSLSKFEKMNLVNNADDLLNLYSLSLSKVAQAQADKEQNIKQDAQVQADAAKTIINEIKNEPEPIKEENKGGIESNKLFKIVDDDLSDPIPGNISQFQNNIRKVFIVGEVKEKTDEEFNKAKDTVKTNVAGILATKAIWKEPAKQSIGTMTSNLSKEEDINAVLDDFSKKTEQRDAGIKQILDTNKELDFIFSGIKDWKDLQNLSEIALTGNANGLKNEMSKASAKLAEINDNIKKTDSNKATVAEKAVNK